jgi:hypothetical protein
MSGLEVREQAIHVGVADAVGDCVAVQEVECILGVEAEERV